MKHVPSSSPSKLKAWTIVLSIWK